ncbi:lipocalin-like domain-containing protein [Patescibacteria group bacterium]
MKKHRKLKITVLILLGIMVAAVLILLVNFHPWKNKELKQDSAIMVDEVKATHVPLVQKYLARYDLLSKTAETGFDTEQNYALPNFMAQDYFKGYADMNTYTALEFPKDHQAQLDWQFGWYFWSGNFLDENDNEVDIVVVFFRRALYPPPIAADLGMSDLDNQIVQTVVAVNYADENLHVNGSNPIIAGDSGQITYGNEPFVAVVGDSSAKSVQADQMFPMNITVNDPDKDLSIDLDLASSKPLLLQGDQGKVPSIYGLGTWYYSFPNIKTSGTVTYQGEARNIDGKMWMDHQWMAGITPTGYPKDLAIQALANITEGYKGEPPASFGWDWSDVQFDDDTEVTFASPHSDKTADLKNMGEDPPANATRDISGKYIDKDGNSQNISGSVTINKWMRSPKSKAWYPNGWDVKMPDQKLEFTMTPSVDQQFIYSGTGEIREGGVIVKGTKNGKDISGYGFGEGVNYSGEEYPLTQNMDLLGIADNDTNRDLLKPKPPSLWLFVQSIIVLASPAALLALIIVYIVVLIKRRRHRKKK